MKRQRKCVVCLEAKNSTHKQLCIKCDTLYSKDIWVDSTYETTVSMLWSKRVLYNKVFPNRSIWKHFLHYRKVTKELLTRRYSHICDIKLKNKLEGAKHD